MLEEFDLSSTCMTDRQPKGCRMDAEDKENGKTLVAYKQTKSYSVVRLHPARYDGQQVPHST